MSPDADRQRFEQLVRETRDELLAYALRRSANAEDAADVVSETYLIAWRKLQSVPRSAAARFWLLGVARNVLRRGAQRQRSSEALIARLKEEPADVVRVDLAGSEDRRVRTLRASLKSLSAGDHELLTLYAWEGLTPKEIAKVTGLSANVVRVRLHRARRRLLQRLAQPRTTSAEGMTTVKSAEAQS